MLLFTRILLLSPILAAFVVLSHSADANETTTTEYNVSKEECINAAGSSVMEPLCCHSLVRTARNATVTCTLNYIKLPKTENKRVEFRRLSILSECIYRRKKYIKSKDKLNMGRVKSDANKEYGNGTFAANFEINMYRTCARSAKAKVDSIQKAKGGEEFLRGLRYPFFLFLFECVITFSKENCPYSNWMNKNGAADNICAQYAKQCDKYLDEINAVSV